MTASLLKGFAKLLLNGRKKETNIETGDLSQSCYSMWQLVASLFRLFPSKEALAEALLLQYAQYVLDRFTELR
jgi:hypothetical protein